MKQMRLVVAAFVVALVLIGCKKNEATAPTTPHEAAWVFSFENGFEGWSANGTDLHGPPVVWSIERTQRVAAAGHSSIEYYLNNLNDAGKIWIQRPFGLRPSTRYRVRIGYQFGTRDFGSINLWTIITGVHTAAPQSRDDLTYQDHTGHGADSDVGLRWVTKQYEFETTSPRSGVLYVALGVWGTWETPRSYFVDAVQLTFSEVVESELR